MAYTRLQASKGDGTPLGPQVNLHCASGDSSGEQYQPSQTQSTKKI